MRSSNTRVQDRRQEYQTQTQSRTTTRRPFFLTIFSGGRRPRMPSVFSILRASLYSAVLAWTIICLAISVHFEGILLSSDLTRFIPFAIFVCSASLLIILALLGFSFWKERNPISTRIELGCLGLAGTLWLALGAFLASSDADGADVECFSSSDADSEPVDIPDFNTETYHAQYRVLEAFSFFNVILIWGFLLLLLILAFKQHLNGENRVWTTSVTAFPWFVKYETKQLPAPVTTPVRSKSTQSRRTATSSEKTPEERRIPRGRRPSPTRNESPTYVHWMPHATPAQALVSHTRDKYHRAASPRR